MVQYQSLDLVLELDQLVSVVLRDLRRYPWQFLAVRHPALISLDDLQLVVRLGSARLAVIQGSSSQ